MAGALGASAAFRPGTRAARVFLERNPYVAWEETTDEDSFFSRGRNTEQRQIALSRADE